MTATVKRATLRAVRAQRLLQRMGLWPVFRLAALTHYRWALREIHPLHPDVSFIVTRIAELEAA